MPTTVSKYSMPSWPACGSAWRPARASAPSAAQGRTPTKGRRHRRPVRRQGVAPAALHVATARLMKDGHSSSNSRLVNEEVTTEAVLEQLLEAEAEELASHLQAEVLEDWAEAYLLDQEAPVDRAKSTIWQVPLWQPRSY